MPRGIRRMTYSPIGPTVTPSDPGVGSLFPGTPGLILRRASCRRLCICSVGAGHSNVIDCILAAGGSEPDIERPINLVHVEDLDEMNRAYSELFSNRFRRERSSVPPLPAGPG